MNDRPKSKTRSIGLKSKGMFGAVMLGAVMFGGIQIVLTSGCAREEIHSYRVEKENFGAAQSPSQAKPSNSSKDEVTWVVPESWQEVETTSSMRFATFQTPPGLEIAVTTFPGDVGGLVANVNRWRDQIGLDKIDEEAVIKSVQRLSTGNVIYVDLNGDNARLLGTIISVGDGNTWFVKTVGPAHTVEQIKQDLISFSASFHLHNDSHDHSAHDHSDHESDHEDDGHDHSSHEGSSHQNADEDHSGHQHAEGEHPEPAPQTQPQPQQTSEQALLNWKKPSQWTADPDASSILMGAFFAENGGRATLTALTGQGRDVLSNINRWRGQLGLDPVLSMADQPSTDLGQGALFVDMVSADGQSRMAAGIVPLGEQTLFFKLTGSVSQVEEELERFAVFVHEIGVQRMGEP